MLYNYAYVCFSSYDCLLYFINQSQVIQVYYQAYVVIPNSTIHGITARLLSITCRLYFQCLLNSFMQLMHINSLSSSSKILQVK